MSGVPLVLVAGLLVGLTSCCALAACGGEQDAPTRAAGSSAAVHSSRSIVFSERATAVGAARCDALTPQRALAEFVAIARRSEVKATAGMRRALVARAKAMPSSTRRAPAAMPVAAALYASTRSERQRPGAYRGCLAALQAAAR